MTFSMLPLLVHCPGIPSQVRAIVRAAASKPVVVRVAELEAVVALLRVTTGLRLEDARELLDLPPRPSRAPCRSGASLHPSP